MKTAVFAALILVTIPMIMFGGDRVIGQPFATRSEVIARHGMAATSQPLATQVAIDMLKQGGSAVDAAIAANAMLGLVEPTGDGIGGDLFAIVWDAKTKRLYGLNASGRSPASLTLEHFKKLGLTRIPAYGPLPVSVPGAVDGWFELHGKFGKLPMTTILVPTIQYARDDFPVSEVIANAWQFSVPALQEWAGFKETFMPNGRAPEKGEVFENPYLASTLEKIANGGRDVFYKGEIAKTIDSFMKKNGGFLSYQDLASHTSDWVEPVSTNYRGYDVWELPPNGQGIAARRVGFAVAGILISLGLFPKLAALVGLMPRSVLGGATIVLFATVTLAGLRIVGSGGWTRRNELILAITLSLGLGVSMVPDWVGNLDRSIDHPVVAMFLSSIKVVLESGLAVGAITATLMNLMLPNDTQRHQDFGNE